MKAFSEKAQCHQKYINKLCFCFQRIESCKTKLDVSKVEVARTDVKNYINTTCLSRLVQFLKWEYLKT